MKKWFPFILIAVLALVIFFIQKYRDPPGDNEGSQDKNKPAKINRQRGFDRRTSYLEYSNHAICRMDCRKISRSEVQEIMEQGKINYKKSDLRNSRCPRY